MTDALAVRYKPGEAELVVIDPTSKGGKPSIAIVKHTEQGMIRAIRTRIYLDPNPKMGHIYCLTKRDDEIPSITAAGYDQINKGMGVSFYIPDSMMGPDGHQVSNPHILRDEHDTIRRVTYKMAGFGRNAVGNWMLVTTVLPYELEPLFAQDILKKWRKWIGKDKPKQIQKWGKIFAANDIPEKDDIFFDDNGEPDPTPTQHIKIPGGTVLVVQLKDQVLDVIEENANRVRFASRNAETIARRRILKVFAAQNKVDPATMSVTVTAWVQSDRKGMHDIKDMIEKAEGGAFEIEGQPVENQNVAESITLDDEQEALGGRLDADEPSQDDEDPIDVGVTESKLAPTKTEKKKSPEKQIMGVGDSELYKKINTSWVSLTPDQKNKLSKKWKFKWMKEVKEFSQQDANDLLADIESEKGSAS